jgi:hypothetical protein
VSSPQRLAARPRGAAGCGAALGQQADVVDFWDNAEPKRSAGLPKLVVGHSLFLDGEQGSTMRIRRTLAAAAALLLVASTLLSAGTASAAGSKPNARSKLLSVSDLPAGWSVNHSSTSGSAGSSCLAALKSPPKGGSRATASFADHGSFPVLSEVLATGSNESARWSTVNKHLAECKSITLGSGTGSYKASLAATSFPTMGKQSAAYALTVVIKGVNIGIDLVLFRTVSYVGVVEYGDLGTPSLSQAQMFVGRALGKIKGIPTKAAASTSVPPTAPPTTIPPTTTTVPPTTIPPTTVPPTTTPPAPAATPTSACTPLSNEGTCYEPGEYCRATDHGASGTAGDGEAITCADNNGWRWEPA